MSLQAAIAAVRAESGERSTVARATRGRVLASIERSPRRRLHAVVAAVIASMFGASAFAWYGKPLPTPAAVPPAIVQDHVVPAPEPVRPVQAVTRVDTHVTQEPSFEPVVEPTVMPPVSASMPAPPAAASDVAPPAATPAVAPPAAPDVAPPTEIAAAAQPDAELALYAAAHELHFKARDLIAALAAWNQYLAAAPMGRLAPEARFNRLVALVKLERWDDAARDLDALTHGDSTYRAPDVERLRALVNSRRPR